MHIYYMIITRFIKSIISPYNIPCPPKNFYIKIARHFVSTDYICINSKASASKRMKLYTKIKTKMMQTEKRRAIPRYNSG